LIQMTGRTSSPSISIPPRSMPYWRSFGDKPWRGERPVVAPVLLVHGRKPPPNVLGAEIRAGEEQRGAFANAAAQFGKDVRIPSDAELLGWSASVGHFPSEPTPGWIGKWRMRWQGADYNGASAGSITTRHFAISCAGSCSPPPEPVRPTLEELSRLGWRQGGAPHEAPAPRPRPQHCLSGRIGADRLVDRLCGGEGRLIHLTR